MGAGQTRPGWASPQHVLAQPKIQVRLRPNQVRLLHPLERAGSGGEPSQTGWQHPVPYMKPGRGVGLAEDLWGHLAELLLLLVSLRAGAVDESTWVRVPHQLACTKARMVASQPS